MMESLLAFKRWRDGVLSYFACDATRGARAAG